MVSKGEPTSRRLRANIFKEVSVSRQRGCGEGIDFGYMEKWSKHNMGVWLSIKILRTTELQIIKPYLFWFHIFV